MKFNKENIKKLREGKVTLIADHSKPEMMGKVLGYDFPGDEDKQLRYKYYKSRNQATNHKINTVGELINLSDFFIKEKMTEQERDRQVKELLARDFPVELPSKFPHDRFNHLNSYLSRDKATLIALLEMRDTYRQGADLDGTDRSSISHKLFSFQDWSTLDLFEKNFKAELEQVKELIS